MIKLWLFVVRTPVKFCFPNSHGNGKTRQITVRGKAGDDNAVTLSGFNCIHIIYYAYIIVTLYSAR